MSLKRFATRVPWASLVWAGAFAAPFVIYFAYVWRYSINVPIHDDYAMVLRFMNRFLEAPTLRGKAAAIWLQQNDSRVIVIKLQALLQYAITGRVNLRGLLIVGNCIQAILALVLSYQARRAGLGRYATLAVPYILLAPVSTQNMNWVSGQVYTWSALFGAMFCVALERHTMWRACMLYVLSIFTFAGGLILYPLGLAYLVVKKRWSELLIFGTVATAFTLLYLYRFSSSSDLLHGAFANFGQAAKAFFAFFGNALYSYEIALEAGMALAVMLIVIALSMYDINDFECLFAAWLLMNGVLVALGRSNVELGVGILPPRYAVYSLLTLVLIAMWGIPKIPRFPLLQRLPFLPVLLCIGYFGLALVVNQAGKQFERERDYKITGLTAFASQHDASRLVYQESQAAQQILLDSQRLGIYDYAAVGRALQHPVDWLAAVPAYPVDAQESLDKLDSSHISGWALIPNINSSKSTVYLLLKNGNRVARLSTFAGARPDVATAFGVQGYTYSGFEVYLAAYALPPGTYDVGLLVQNGQSSAMHWIGQSLTIQ